MVFEVHSFLALTIGIIVYFLGMRLDRIIPFLRAYNIPEPVTGGILASLAALALYAATGVELDYDLAIWASMRALATWSRAADLC